MILYLLLIMTDPLLFGFMSVLLGIGTLESIAMITHLVSPKRRMIRDFSWMVLAAPALIFLMNRFLYLGDQSIINQAFTYGAVVLMLVMIFILFGRQCRYWYTTDIELRKLEWFVDAWNQENGYVLPDGLSARLDRSKLKYETDNVIIKATNLSTEDRAAARLALETHVLKHGKIIPQKYIMSVLAYLAAVIVVFLRLVRH